MIQRFVFVITLFATCLLMYSCKDKGSNPPDDQHPPGYQVDIPWPSLADSPWPMNHHDPQGTGRSQYQGPITANTVNFIDSLYSIGGITLLNDSTFFISYSKGQSPVRIYLSCLKTNNNHVWNYQLPNWSEVITTPLVRNDLSTLWAAGQAKTIYCLGKNGNFLWQFAAGGEIWESGITIGKNGIIYFTATDRFLYALSPNGALLWKYYHPKFAASASTGLIFSTDGKVLYIPGYPDVCLLAFNVENQQILWTFGTTHLQTQPLVDRQDNVYVITKVDSINSGKKCLYSLSSSGALRWSYVIHNPRTDEYVLQSYLSMNKLGELSFTLDSLYHISYGGVELWKIKLNAICWSSPVTDADGNIYVSELNDNGYLHQVRCFSRDGVQKTIWNIPYDQLKTGLPAVLTSDRKIIIPTFKSNKMVILK